MQANSGRGGPGKARSLPDRAALVSTSEGGADGDAAVVVTADTVSDVSVDPAGGSGREQFFAKLTFRHAKSGKWTFLLPTRNDARLAVKALTRLLGRDAVSVDVDL